jgi:hypothetical protein
MSVGAPGASGYATTIFQISVASAQIESIQSTAGTLKSADPVAEPTWVEVRPSDNVPTDSVEWTVDGRVTPVASAPWAVLLDPDQLADGRHELTARITSRGQVGPTPQICTNLFGIGCPPPQPRTAPTATRVIPAASPVPPAGSAETGPRPGSNLDLAVKIASVANDQFNRSLEVPDSTRSGH